MFFDRLRACDKKSLVESIVTEPTYGKNISKGSKLASSYELMFEQKPRIANGIDCSTRKIISIEERNSHSALKRLQCMLRNIIRKHPKFHIGQNVYIWRDNFGWIEPAKITSLEDHNVSVEHDGHKNRHHIIVSEAYPNIPVTKALIIIMMRTIHLIPTCH